MRWFIDTNVVVYLFDNDAPEKKRQATELFEEGRASQSLLLSTQVLQEFYVAATRKLKQPLTPDIAEQAVRELTSLPLVNVDSDIVLAAIMRSRQLGFSLWDSLIVEAALRGGADTLKTEDLQDGKVIDGLRVENPFR